MHPTNNDYSAVGAYKSLKTKRPSSFFCAVLRQQSLFRRITRVPRKPAAASLRSGQPDSALCLQFLEELLHLVPGECRQDLLQIMKGASGFLILQDVLAKQSLVRLTVEALPTRVGAVLPEKGVELSRENEPHTTSTADPLDDALVQEVRKPLFEVLGQRLFTLDGVQYEDVPSAEGGQTFSTDFLEKPEEGGILNLPAQGQLDLVIVRPRKVRLRLPFFDGLLEHPVGTLAGSLNQAALRTGVGDSPIPGRLPPE